MPVYRVTLFANQSVMGMSETYYTRGDVSASNIAGLVTVLLDQRASIGFDNMFFVGVRIADLGVASAPQFTRRKSVFFTPGAWPYPGTATTLIVPVRGKFTTGTTPTSQHPDQWRAALHNRFTFGDGYNTIRYLCGLPDSISFTEPDTIHFDGNPQWLSNYNAWRQHISTTWALRGRTTILVDPYVPVERLVIQQSAPSLLGVQVDAATSPSIAVGQLIHLRGFRPKRRGTISLNGRYYIDSVNTTLEPGKRIYYLRGTAGVNPNDYKILGTVQKVAYQLFNIQGIEPVRIGTHKRGRPSPAPRGRRLARESLDP